MAEGWHRFHSASDDTKRIGFTKNGRSIRFHNRTVPPDEYCYSLFETKIGTSNYNSTTDKSTTTILPAKSTGRSKQPNRSPALKSSTLAKPKSIQTGSPLNGMPKGESQHRHHNHHHNHQQHHLHQHKRHHKPARRTPLPKHQNFETNRNVMNSRATNRNLSALTRTNINNNNDNVNNIYNKNIDSSSRSSLRDISNNNLSAFTFGQASSNFNNYNVSNTNTNRSNASEPMRNTSIISSVNRTNKTKTQINLANHKRYRHSHRQHQQLPFHVQTSSKTNNFQSDQSEQKHDIFEQRNRNERKVVAFHDDIHSVQRSHSNHHSSHDSHSFHHMREAHTPLSKTPTDQLIGVAEPKVSISTSKNAALRKKHAQGNFNKHLSSLQKLNDPYVHRHRHHHGDNQSFISTQYFNEAAKQTKNGQQ